MTRTEIEASTSELTTEKADDSKNSEIRLLRAKNRKQRTLETRLHQQERNTERWKHRKKAYSLICGTLAVGYRDQSLLQLTAYDLSHQRVSAMRHSERAYTQFTQ